MYSVVVRKSESLLRPTFVNHASGHISKTLLV